MVDDRARTADSVAFVIALDGPAASGKSTVGLEVAKELGFFYLDTGLLYRGLTWLALRHGSHPGEGAALARLAQTARLEVRPPTVQDGRQADVLAGGEDITRQLHTPDVDANVSRVSAHPEVREALRPTQRAAICAPGTILAGRDIGTVIAPDAQLKVWLTASVEERARRRAAQTGEPYESVLETMLKRDRIDGTRVVAPMVKAPDAIEIDTDRLPPDAIVRQIVALARERMGRRAVDIIRHP
jgi:cytidylate kinase